MRAAFVVLCVGTLTASSIGLSQETAGDTDQYRKSLEERRSELNVMSENVVRIDDAIQTLQDELEAENRRGRAKILRARIQRLGGQKEALNQRIAAERRVLSQDGALEPGEVFDKVAAKDLAEEQAQRAGEIQVLDARIAALKSRLDRRRGSRVTRRNLSRQIQELSSKRDALAARPGVDVQDAVAVRAELARRFAQEEANRRSEVEAVRARVAEHKSNVAEESRRIRRKNVEARMAELKLRQQEIDIEPPRRRYRRGEAGGGPIGRGLRARRTLRERRAGVIDQRITTLRRRLRTEGRSARRKSINLQITELERQKQAIGKREAPFQPPPRRGFGGVRYRGTYDLDHEYKTPRTSDQQ
jgi:hypothetical protein